MQRAAERGPAEESAWLDVIWRAYLLRKAGRFPVILAERGKIFVVQDELDCWGSRRRVGDEELRAMVEEADARIARPVRGESGAAAVARAS